MFITSLLIRAPERKKSRCLSMEAHRDCGTTRQWDTTKELLTWVIISKNIKHITLGKGSLLLYDSSYEILGEQELISIGKVQNSSCLEGQWTCGFTKEEQKEI